MQQDLWNVAAGKTAAFIVDEERDVAVITGAGDRWREGAFMR